MKIVELWYRIYQAVLTKQRQESFVILSRELSEFESERAFSLVQLLHNSSVTTPVVQ